MPVGCGIYTLEVQMTKEEFEEREQAEREQAEREKHDEMVRELVEQARILLACNFGVIPPKAETNIQEV